MNTNIHEDIALSKEKFFQVNSFYHKYALEAKVFVLEDYLNTRDIVFHNSIKKQKFYSFQKNYLQNNLIDDFKRFMNQNYDNIYEMLLPYAKSINGYNSVVINQYIDHNTCLKIITDFLYTIDISLYNLFCKLYQSGHILFKDDYHGGIEINEKKKDSIYIIMGPLNNVKNMGTLIHEMGHAYKDYLFEDYHRYYSVNDLLQSEISSEVLELMFYNYLVNNNIFRMQALSNLHKYDQRMNTDAINLLNSKEFNKDYLRTLSYMLGRIIAKEYTSNITCSYHDLIKYIYLHDIKRIFNDLSINNEKIVNGINKEFCLIR